MGTLFVIGRLSTLTTVLMMMMTLTAFVVVVVSASSQPSQQLSLASMKNPKIPNLLPLRVKKVLRTIRHKGDLVRNHLDQRGPILDLSSSPSKLPGYMRGAGIPVYMVTTPWGSPYMLSDKTRDLIASSNHVEETMGQNFLGDEEAEDEEGGADDEDSPASRKKSKYDKPTRPSKSIAPMFLDHDDALNLLTEMNQMGGFDVRITATNMARALRQASVLGKGMPTGSIGENGNVEGYLRYKLVPSSRELYYASGCQNRESVGFSSPQELDSTKQGSTGDRLGKKVIQGARGSEVGGVGGGGGGIDKVYGPFVRWATPFELLGRKTIKEAPQLKKGAAATPVKKDPYGFLKDGRKGIPVFYIKGLEVSKPSLLSKKSMRKNIPLFLSYEDCAQAWMDLNSSNEKMPEIEVYNYADIITSIDKHQHQQHVTRSKSTNGSKTLQDFIQRFKGSSQNKHPIEDIMFVPSSKSVNYKEYTLTRRGNCKARLRPMR